MVGFKLKELKIIAVLIPVVGILIALIYAFSHTNEPSNQLIFHILHSTLVTAGIWLGCYAIVTFLWRKYPWERNPIKHLVIEIITIMSYLVLFGLFVYKFELACNFNALEGKNGVPPVADFFILILITFFITSIHEAVFFYQQWKYNFSKSARLEKDNIEAKYETLKSQINPHFLFNSLNSLTALVDDNSEAVDYIQNLSEFLRYVLKSRDRELVLMRDEVTMLHKYLGLQKARFRNNLIIEFNVREEFYHYSLPPLVLQMLAENCIKHNVISKDKPLTLTIVAEKEFISIKNNLQKKTDVTSTGQGLNNIAARFAYFTNKEVKIMETTDHFKVEVPLLTVEL
ncbi:MAG: histidine kinase [Salinivirgaceae bacterium]